MDFTGRYTIPAAPAVVWAGLMDPEVLKACIPGCQSLTKPDADHFDAVATLKIGPVKATFKASIAITDMDAPHRCVLRGEGQGGVAGFARGEADVVLTPDGDATILTYTAKATVGGKLAQIGQRLIDGAAKQIADEFFSKFAAEVVPPPVTQIIVGAPVGAPEPMAVVSPDIAADAKREGVAPEIWVVGLIGVIVILLLLFGVTL
ncbi:MAG TPA: carbon monoxide dehydrogenase subunit G [Rhizomicrobium sp.]|jgi:hypothetical protein